MKTQNYDKKLPPAVWGLLIFMAVVLAVLIAYWAVVVNDIIEQRRIAEDTAEFARQIYVAIKYPLT